MSPLAADKDFYQDLVRTGSPLSRNIEDFPDGIIVPVDKPWRWTSADVVRKLKYAAIRHFGKKNLKVGHAGTLDPLATGVLLVCIGPACRCAEELQRHDKEYIAGISFGATTPSYDLEKDIDCRYPVDGVSEVSVRQALVSFVGTTEQVAPLFSAKSAGGVRAYEIARKLYRRGLPLDEAAQGLLSRQLITISEAELLRFSPDGEGIPHYEAENNAANMRINFVDTSEMHLPRAEVRLSCSKGTYVRAFARDLGEALCSGAHLDSLRRTRSGSFRAEKSLTPSEALKIFNAGH